MRRRRALDLRAARRRPRTRRPIGRPGVALAALAVGAAYLQGRRVERRRLEADPDWALLSAPSRGRAIPVSSADGTLLHAEEFGPEDAPTIVLIHGWACGLRFWEYQIRDLSRDHRVVAYDLRGHCDSASPATGDYSLQALGADLQAVLEQCIPEGERALVAGHSLGAMTIAAWAKLHPDEVQRRVGAAALVNTGLGDLVTETLVVRMPTRLGRMKQAGGRFVLGAPVPLPKGPDPIMDSAFKFVALGPKASPARVAFCKSMVTSCRPQVRAAFGASMAAMELHHALELLTVPTLVIAGERDRLTPPVHARRLAQLLPRLTELVELPGVGHMGPVEAPEEVGSQLRGLALAHAELAGPSASSDIATSA
jgi:pimeloyl-ACP methyl ester carboxylesterase